MKASMHAKVFLVGAGPGDPDLLTVKAHALIRAAEVILHDDLVSAPILALANPHAMVVNVGKRCGTKNITQSEINRLMIASARRGLSVIRLKSGDPGLFGRLAEERDALESAGIPYEIVPGVTAALSAAASLGVSLTDRRTSSRIVVISAHRAHENENEPPADWRGLASNSSTLVIYMPGRDLAAVSMPTRLQQSSLPQALPNRASIAPRSLSSTPLLRCRPPQFSSSAAPSSAPHNQLPIPFLLHGNRFFMEWKSASQRKTRIKALKGASPNGHTIDAAKKLVIAIEGRLQTQALARHLGRRALARNLASRLARRNQTHPMVGGWFSLI
jgi:uroporphyrin-III C-methyltransferase